MDWNAIGIVADIVAAAAIVITLLLLVRQLGQENITRRAETRQQMAESSLNFLESLLRYPELRRAHAKAVQGDEVTEDERAILRWWLTIWLRHFSNLIYQHDLGGLDEEEIQNSRNLAQGFLATPLFRDLIEEQMQRLMATMSVAMMHEMVALGILDRDEADAANS